MQWAERCFDVLRKLVPQTKEGQDSVHAIYIKVASNVCQAAGASAHLACNGVLFRRQ